MEHSREFNSAMNKREAKAAEKASSSAQLHLTLPMPSLPSSKRTLASESFGQDAHLR
jgi:hypothetical protein